MAGRIGALVAGLVLVAAACGDAGDSTVPTSAAPATVAPATTAAPATTTPPAADPTTTTAPTTSTTAVAEDAAATTTTAAAPADPAWQQLPASGPAPPARRNAVLAVDPAANVAYLHGGRSGAESRADLWRLDLASGAWEELTPSGEAPTARFSHTGVWDEQRNRFVVFSGEGQGFGDFFSDVWAYDPAADAWELLAPDGAGPANRYGSCAGYDAAGDRFLITHGFTDSGRFDDTWSFDLASSTWSQVATSGPVPGARCLHDCSYDPVAGALVMFGGQDDDVPFLADTWVLTGDAWAEGPAGPSARKFPATAAAGGGVVLFGGDTAAGDAGDTWSYAGGAWTELAPAGAPPARESAAAATHAGTGEVWLFGGRGADGDLADVWRFSPGG